jgi:hypothetical protein
MAGRGAAWRGKGTNGPTRITEDGPGKARQGAARPGTARRGMGANGTTRITLERLSQARQGQARRG